FVANVDICLARLDNPRGNQRAFAEAVWIALKIVAILECTRLSLVGIDREHSRSGLRADERPFATSRKACPSKAAQTRIAYDLDQFIARAFVAQTIFQERVAAGLLIRIEINVGLPRMRMRFLFHSRSHRLDGGIQCLDMTNCTSRCVIASPHAGGMNNASLASELARQILHELLSAGHGARQRIAHANSNRRRR